MSNSTRSLNLEDIVSPQEVIHPALDWVKGQLIVGVQLKDGQRAVLSSKHGLTNAEEVGVVCEQGRNFEGVVSLDVAREITDFLKLPAKSRPSANGMSVIKSLAAYFKRFVTFSHSWWPDVLACWTLGTYLYPIFQTYPYLRITSPQPGCGKSQLGGIIAALSFNGELMVSPSEAQLFRLPEITRGVQVWDEVETSGYVDQKRFATIQPVLLNGYRIGGSVPRQVGKGYEKSARFHVYCPRVFIGLSALPEAASQRTIKVYLQKRGSSEKIEHYQTADHVDEERRIRDCCLIWAIKSADLVRTEYSGPSLREYTEKRLGPGRICDDVWLPILSIASAIQSQHGITRGKLMQSLETASSELAQQVETGPQHHQTCSATSVSPQHQASRAALQVLKWRNPIEPTALAAHVSKSVGFDVTSQMLSKELAQIGIRAKKVKGRRVFQPTKEEVSACETLLGAEQNGQQGHHEENSHPY